VVRNLVMGNHFPFSALILGVYILLTLTLTYPLAFNLASAVPNDIGDPLLNTWILAWVNHALLVDPWNFFNANIYHPLPNTLAYSEHMLSTALVGLPWQLISAEPLVAYNLSLWLTFPLAAFGMYLLIFRWTHHRAAAFMAGLIFAFSPYRFAAIAHLQLLTWHWLPFVVLALDKLIRANLPRRRYMSNTISLVIFLTLQLLASWYLAVYTIFVVGAYMILAGITGIFRPLTHKPSQLVRFSLALLLGLIFTLPLAWPYFSVVADLRAARPLSQAVALAAAPTDFNAAAPFNRVFGPLTGQLRARPGFTEENTLFVGIIPILLALLALWPLTKLTLLDLKRLTIYYVLRVAYFLGFRNTPYVIRSLYPKTTNPTSHFVISFLLCVLLMALLLTWPGPYALLAQLLPVTTIIRVPPRWIIPALFALAGLAGFGFARIAQLLSPRISVLRPALLLLTSGLIVAESLSIPLPLAPVENRAGLNPAYYWLAGQPNPLALIELPLHSAPAPEYPEVKRLYASTLGWWRLVNGYSGYTPARQPQLAQALADFPGPQALTALQNLAQSANLPLWLLVHPGEAPLDRSRWESTDRWLAEQNPALWPVGQFAGDYLYQFQASEPIGLTGSPLATFGPNQTIQLWTYQLAMNNDQLPIPQGYNVTYYQTIGSKLALYWQTTNPLNNDYTIFIHIRAPDGFVRSQADGSPVSGHLPTTVWPTGRLIQDIHPLADPNLAQADHVAIGVYDPNRGERLPAFDATGQPLPDNALILPLP
jgi:hypothetical protein